MGTLPEDRGLDRHGHVRREGDLSLVQPEFAPLVQRYAADARAAFGSDLDSIYLYGSIPRGTARLGVSDLDGQLLLRREPTAADRETVRDLEETLGATGPQVSFVGILLDARAALVDPADHYDGGFHIRVLCTPVWGPDAGEEVAPHEANLELARGVQGDWRGALQRLRQGGSTLAQASASTGANGGVSVGSADGGVSTPPDLRTFCRSTGRRLCRIAFSWVLPRWGGWSSDPAVMHQVVAAFEPGWATPMAAAVRLGWEGEQDLALAQELLGGFAQELTDHGSALGA